MADFQQYYGIALPLDPEEEPADLERLALLWGQLPPCSRCAAAENPDAAWGQDTWFLRAIEHGVRHLAWMLADPDKRDPDPPEPVPSPSQRRDARERQAQALADRAEIDAILGIGGTDG